MAHINDYKLLNQKCLAYFGLLEGEIEKSINIDESKKLQKERLGFYIYILEVICGIKDIPEICDMITDTDFNSIVYGIKDNDEGIDAINIDKENFEIKLFNFKFRNEFNVDKEQGINDSLNSFKFLTFIQNEKTSSLKGKTKEFADKIIELQKSNDIWKTTLYVVSNENKELKANEGILGEIQKLFGIEVITIGLDTISNYMSIRPGAVNSSLMLSTDAIMSYSENELSSNKSYIIRLPINELIRITSNNKSLREFYNIEKIDALSSTELEYGLLFDNVRGYLGETKFNKHIIETLKKEAEKFFMYNNGLTITTKNIEANPVSGNKKMKLDIQDFQVVNGGQTLRTLHEFNKQNPENLENFLTKGEILVRIFQTGTTEGLVNKIAEFTNSQNAISPIDLKSLSSEQIQLEQFLGEHSILYARKSGETGLSQKSYTHKISMEKFSQILFSINGNPEKASNQKKKIFEKYYSSIFGEGIFNINESVDIVNKYFEIRKEYGGNEFDYNLTDQKIFYIFYLDRKKGGAIKSNIEFLENQISDYFERISDEGRSSTAARILIQSEFKSFLDSAIQNENEDSI